MVQTISRERVRGERLSRMETQLRFSSSGLQLLANLSQTQTLLATFGSAAPCSSAQVEAAAPAAAEPVRKTRRTSCGCFGLRLRLFGAGSDCHAHVTRDEKVMHVHCRLHASARLPGSTPLQA